MVSQCLYWKVCVQFFFPFNFILLLMTTKRRLNLKTARMRTVDCAQCPYLRFPHSKSNNNNLRSFGIAIFESILLLKSEIEYIVLMSGVQSESRTISIPTKQGYRKRKELKLKIKTKMCMTFTEKKKNQQPNQCKGRQCRTKWMKLCKNKT